jgi:hypothetical protein
MSLETKIGGLIFFVSTKRKRARRKMQEEKEKDCHILSQSF